MEVNLNGNISIKKRERRPNYTLEEKAYFTELVSEYSHIVDDRRTGGTFYKKKREAWKMITLKYNSRCTTGPREIENLKILYDHMKYQARKNDGECLTNTTAKLRLFTKNDYSQEKSETQAEDKIIALQTMKQEKMNGHGGSCNNPKPSDPEQAEPPSSPYDSAADYFRENDNEQSPIDPSLLLDVSLSETQNMETKCESSNTMSESNSWSSRHSFTELSETNNVKKSALQRSKKKKPMSLKALKHLYFKKKFQNANLERKRLLQEIAHAQEKHTLEMAILRRSLQDQ